MSFLFGKKPKWEQKSRLGPEQQPLYQQMLAALQGQGAGGAFGASADYFRDLLSDDSKTFEAFAAPEMRRFKEDIIPGLSEQFAGMGSGGLSSSGFRNAGVQASTDLSERLGAIRAQLRQQGAQGLAGMGQFGLGQFNENIYNRGQPGLIDSLGQGLGMAAGSFFGPAGTAAGSALGNAASSWLSNKFGKSDPYGGQR